MTSTTPRRLMILHFSQRGFTEARTFIVLPRLAWSGASSPTRIFRRLPRSVLTNLADALVGWQ
jgi:hypothetical protein